MVDDDNDAMCPRRTRSRSAGSGVRCAALLLAATVWV